MKFELNDDKIKNIISQTKNKSVDLEKTIKIGINAFEMGDDGYVEIEVGRAFDSIQFFMEKEGLEYEFLSKEYFDFINKCVETGEYGDVYIALAYANELMVDGDELEYHIDGVDENLIGSTGISTGLDVKTLLFNINDDIIYGGINEDYGILIKKIDGKNVATFGNRDVHGFYGPYAEPYFKSIEDQLNEPLYQILIEMMYDSIIFEE